MNEKKKEKTEKATQDRGPEEAVTYLVFTGQVWVHRNVILFTVM